MRIIYLAAVLFGVLLLSYLGSSKSDTASEYQFVNDTNNVGFVTVDCWFKPERDWPSVNCFRMQVPEDHSRPESRHITFPVIVFKSKIKSNKAPLLHLGAGGPGAPMYLDYFYSVNELLRAHDDMSVNIGRDLYIIDPRGTGLSEPLLSCGEFVDNELLRFELNLPIEENISRIDKDYFKCIDDFLAEGIDLSSYNSFSIAKDIEALRLAANVDQWVLLGVSYGSTYAQTITELFPGSVEAMVLDSSSFPQIKAHHDFIQRTLRPYQKLFNYCDNDPACTSADKNMEERIWTLVRDLTAEPIFMLLDNPYNDDVIPFALNGDRLLAAMFEGIYGVDIFKELPSIVSDLEARGQEEILPYVMSYVEYMLDRSWGDVSASAHYCYEDEPFIDFDKIEHLVETLPEGYIRDSARHYDTWSNYCERMKIHSTAPVLVPSKTISVPTLFLQGRFDSVTPLSDVESKRADFSNHRLAVFNKSHSILTADECAEQIAGRFIEEHYLARGDVDCGDSIRVR